jgi:hypothetical protein
MLNTIEITSVKIQKNGWLLNGNIFVPDTPGNIEREAILKWLAEGNTPEPEFTDAELLAQEKALKLVEATAAYNTSISALVGNTDQYEMTSWAKQEAEARAYMVDNTIATPLLSGMVVARGLDENVADLAKIIIAKADAYQAAYASILGTYQAKQKAIAAAKTVEEVQAIK